MILYNVSLVKNYDKSEKFMDDKISSSSKRIALLGKVTFPAGSASSRSSDPKPSQRVSSPHRLTVSYLALFLSCSASLNLTQPFLTDLMSSD